MSLRRVAGFEDSILHPLVLDSNHPGMLALAARGDCIVLFRKSALGQTAFSVRAVREWNLIPIHISNLKTYASFKINLKKWLTGSQDCQHYI